MSPGAIMIFAAGLGTRMGALTRDRPKPLIEVAGRPLIDHALTLARQAGIERIVVNSHAHADMLEAHLAAQAPDVRVAHEPLLLETGGGLLAARPLLATGTAFTLNADMVWTGPNPLEALARDWPEARARGCAGPALPGPAGRGRRAFRSGRFLPRSGWSPDSAGGRRAGGLRVCRGADS